MIASDPEYQPFTHSSHPRIVLQHRANKIGGFIGVIAQMQHLNVSFNRVCRPKGIFEAFDSAKIASVLVLMVDISFRNSLITSLSVRESRSSVSLPIADDGKGTEDLDRFFSRTGV